MSVWMCVCMVPFSGLTSLCVYSSKPCAQFRVFTYSGHFLIIIHMNSNYLFVSFFFLNIWKLTPGFSVIYRQLESPVELNWDLNTQPSESHMVTTTATLQHVCIDSTASNTERTPLRDCTESEWAGRVSYAAQSLSLSVTGNRWSCVQVPDQILEISCILHM